MLAEKGKSMYKALYREYRPEVFEEVIGQEHIVKILRNQLKQDSVSHAYLFCGTRGTGKTTTARLIAKAVNCLSDGEKPCGECENCRAIKEGTFMDLMEIDAASNNGIDNIRELRESIKYPPSVGRKKVYIIDEVHMLSTAAFNAFLKTLEEPPDNVMFILATTEPQKLPQTILSRCIRMDFRRVSEKKIFARMKEICENRHVNIDDDALWLVAANADGSVRDGLTLLDQCISGRDGQISREEILDTLGAVGEDTYIEITNAIIEKQVSECILAIDKILDSGKDARQILMGLMNHYRNLLLTKYVKNPENVLNMSIENVQRVKAQSEKVELMDINEAIIELTKTGTDINASTQPRILLELAVVKLATGLTSRKLSACMDENGKNACTVNFKEKTPVEALRRPEERVEEKTFDKPEKPLEKNPLENEKNMNFEMPKAEKPVAGYDGNMEELWDEVCKEASDEKFELVVLHRNSYPRELTKGEIVISVTNAIAGSLVEKHKQLLMDVIEKLTGTRKMIVIAGKDENKDKGASLDKTLEQAQSVLGMDIKLVD